MATDVIMPQMGESIAEGTITKWLVPVGERIERDQPLLEISTDKVDAEIPSPAAGTLLEVLFQEGETVQIDTVIARVGEPAEEAAAPARPAPGPTVAEAPAPAAAPAAVASTASGPLSREERLRTFSSPVVRKIAAAEGVDLEQLEGTGLGGRVTKRDILQYLEQRETSTGGPPAAAENAAAPPAAAVPAAGEPAPAGPAPASEPAPSDERLVPSAGRDVATRPAPAATPASGGRELEFSVPAYADGERVRVEPMSPIRRLTAAHMLYSQDTSAHVATVFECDMSSIVAVRNRAKDKFQEKVGTKLSFMPFLFKAVIDGLRTYPKFNASVDGTDIVYKEDINLGIAVALEWGLIVPVIHHADRLNLTGLAAHANDLAERARAKRLSPDEVRGGTFTVTNPGVFGSLFGTPMINQPQVAILCVGAIQKRPVVITDAEGNDGIGIRSMAYLALSYDHRLIDGADAEQFMVRMKQTLTESSWDELSPFFE